MGSCWSTTRYFSPVACHLSAVICFILRPSGLSPAFYPCDPDLRAYYAGFSLIATDMSWSHL